MAGPSSSPSRSPSSHPGRHPDPAGGPPPVPADLDTSLLRENLQLSPDARLRAAVARGKAIATLRAATRHPRHG